MTTNNEYSSDELNPPEWLNKSFFEKAVRKYVKDDTITVTNLVLRPGTKPGEHYASVMFRAEVTYISNLNGRVNNILKLILKTPPFEEGTKKEFLKESTAFKTEMRMYEEVLPEMQRILHEIGDQTIIAPTFVYQSNHPAPVIILIDESPNGFRTYTEPLNLQEIQVVIERIAKFHACSVFLNENGFDLTTFNDCLYELVEGRTDFMEELFMPTIKKGIDTVKTWQGHEEVGHLLDKSFPIMTDRIRDLFLNSEKRIYSVLLHTDFHFKNLIYRNEGLKSEDLLLVDYQFCMWNSPANDIFLLLCSISNDDIRENHRTQVIHTYFQIFRETLKRLGYKQPIPRLLDLQLELLRCGLMEFMHFMIFVPFQYVDWASIDINEMMETKDFHETTKAAWNSSDFQTKLVKLVKRLHLMGNFG